MLTGSLDGSSSCALRRSQLSLNGCWPVITWLLLTAVRMEEVLGEGEWKMEPFLR